LQLPVAMTFSISLMRIFKEKQNDSVVARHFANRKVTLRFMGQNGRLRSKFKFHAVRDLHPCFHLYEPHPCHKLFRYEKNLVTLGAGGNPRAMGKGPGDSAHKDYGRGKRDVFASKTIVLAGMFLRKRSGKRSGIPVAMLKMMIFVGGCFLMCFLKLMAIHMMVPMMVLA